MREFDTIAAVATSIGEGGVSIIRVSGSNALAIVSTIFKGKSPKDIREMKTYTMRYGFIVDKEDNEIDEVIISYMKGPRSFTAEDVVEINCHGGVVITNRILEEVLRAGARLADAGEFTKRAFLNGRIDLSQAEAVIDIITAKSELSAKSALKQSQGKISHEIDGVRQELLGIIANIEATVDYPEEDMEEVTAEQGATQVRDIIKKLESLLKKSGEGKIIREGLKVVIVGKPNVGKSSLMNALTNENRAIVTNIPGTTRDVIEEHITIGGVPVKLIDTAGIRETEDVVEKIGVERSKEQIDEADLIVIMLDSSRELESEDKEIIEYIKDKKHVVLLNKADLPRMLDRDALNELNKEYIYEVSVKEDQGIEMLKDAVVNMFFEGEIDTDDIYVTNNRHKEALIRAHESLNNALGVLDMTMAIDLASIDIRNAWTALGEITGQTLQEDIIDKIFSEFCLGK